MKLRWRKYVLMLLKRDSIIDLGHFNVISLTVLNVLNMLIELPKININSDTERSSIHLDLHLEIYNEGTLKKVYKKRDNYGFPI